MKLLSLIRRPDWAYMPSSWMPNPITLTADQREAVAKAAAAEQTRQMLVGGVK